MLCYLFIFLSYIFCLIFKISFRFIVSDLFHSSSHKIFITLCKSFVLKVSSDVQVRRLYKATAKCKWLESQVMRGHLKFKSKYIIVREIPLKKEY